MLQVTVEGLEGEGPEGLIWRTEVVLTIDGDDVTVLEGDRGVIDFEAALPDLDSGEFIHFEDDRERWVRNLHQLFRTGDTVVRVEEFAVPAQSLVRAGRS